MIKTNSHRDLEAIQRAFEVQRRQIDRLCIRLEDIEALIDTLKRETERRRRLQNRN